MRAALLLAMALPALAGSPCTAQTSAWPDYTTDQRWERMSRFGTLGLVAAIRYAKSEGNTIEEFGQWWGELFAPSWGEPESYSPLQVMRGMRRNLLSWQGAEFEILEQSDARVSARTSRSWAAYFGESGTWYGVTVEELERVNSLFMKAVAEYHGLVFEERREGADLIISFARR